MLHWIGWFGLGVAVVLIAAGLLLRLVLADPWLPLDDRRE